MKVEVSVPELVEVFRIPVLLNNTSQQKWVVQGNNKIHLAYHWLKKTGEVVIRNGIRSPYPS